MKGKLSITVGLPGCGKSTWLDQRRNDESVRLATASKGDFVILCPDDFRFDLTGQYHYPPAEDDVWAQVKRAARVLLRRGHNVVIDATALNKWSRAQWVKIARELDVEITAYVFDAPFEICKARNANRERKVPDDVMQRMHAGFERIEVDEGFDRISSIKTWE